MKLYIKDQVVFQVKVCGSRMEMDLNAILYRSDSITRSCLKSIQAMCIAMC